MSDLCVHGHGPDDAHVCGASTRRCGRRHWFAYYRQVGSSSPTCRRCGAPNPNYRSDDDPVRIHKEMRDARRGQQP